MKISHMIKALLDSGLTEKNIAEQVSTTQPTVNRIKRGGNPAYELGCRIESFYRSQFSDKSNNVSLNA